MTKPTILILGGVDKGNEYALIDDLVKEKVKAIICLGTDNRKIHEAFGNTMSTIVNTMTPKPSGMPTVITPEPSFCDRKLLLNATSRMKP